MIDAKELRLGNYLVNIHKLLVRVSSISIGQTMISYKYKLDDKHTYTEFPDQLWPRELTPSILEKCGFVKNGFNAYELEFKGAYSTSIKALSFSGDYLYLKEKNNKQPFDLITIWNKDIMKQFYLHDLQNLCYSLGHELEIKL